MPPKQTQNQDVGKNSTPRKCQFFNRGYGWTGLKLNVLKDILTHVNMATDVGFTDNKNVSSSMILLLEIMMKFYL